MHGRPAALLTTAMSLLLLSACPSSEPPPDGDASLDGRADTGDLLGDDDNDGLCNVTEMNRATDPQNQDTDGDGYSDFVEATFGYNPLVPSIPLDEEVFRLLEEPGALVRASHTLVIRGSGEDYVGAFESIDPRDPANILADDFWGGSVALFANPPENVAVVESETESFRGVVGTTELNFETTFMFEGGDRFEPCLRAYPFRYQVKRSDGRILAVERYLLIVVPPINTGEWCTPTLPCI